VLLEERMTWTTAFDEKKPPRPLSEMLLPTAFEEASDHTALAVLPYSSGTTGMPKAVMLKHHNIVADLHQITSHDNLVGTGPDCVHLTVLPFYHIYAMVAEMLSALLLGAKLVTMPKFDPKLYLTSVNKHCVTTAFVAPPIVTFLAKHPIADNFLPFTHLKDMLSAAAPLDGDLIELAKKRLGLEYIRQGYGMTEMSPASNLGPKSSIKPGTVGILLPNMQMRLVSSDGEAITEPGKQGEIQCRGPNIMQGYYGDAKATNETLDDDGFLHTGDVGYVDDDGFLFIVDRIKELIKVKGFQVAPAELEGILVKHPKIADAAVIGVAAGGAYGGREGDGQVPKAYVVTKGEESLTEDEVKEFVKTLVGSPSKEIAAVEFVTAIPKSASGKILRKDLRKKEEAAGHKIFA